MLINLKNNLFRRIIVGIVGSIIFISLIIISKWTYFLLFLTIQVISLSEFYNITNLENKFKYMGYFVAIFLFCLTFLCFSHLISYKYLFLSVIIPYLILIFGLTSTIEKSFYNVSYCLLGIFYITCPFTLVNDLIFIDNKYITNLIFSIFFIIWANDIGAYIIGKMFGKHKLAKYISPNKTIEGTIGGIFLAIIVTFILFEINFIKIQSWFIFGIIISVTGTIGDLIASLLKRNFNVKDSSNLLPGHGGFLDRFDSFIFSMPFLYIYLKILI